MSALVGRLEVVSTVEQPEEPVVRIYTPDEAIKRARPLPPRNRLSTTAIPLPRSDEVATRRQRSSNLKQQRPEYFSEAIGENNLTLVTSR